MDATTIDRDAVSRAIGLAADLDELVPAGEHLLARVRVAGRRLLVGLEGDDDGWTARFCEPEPSGDLAAAFDDAVAYAIEWHRPQRRKRTEIPYVSHCLAVASLAMELQPRSWEEAIAALLHDVVEDAGGWDRAAEIAARFGPDVVRIVLANSDTTRTPKPPWKVRKAAYLAALAHKAPDELRVSLADKVHNARSILRDLETVGPEVFSRFSATPEETCWYYRGLAQAFLARADELGPAAATLARELDRVVGEIEALRP